MSVARPAQERAEEFPYMNIGQGRGFTREDGAEP